MESIDQRCVAETSTAQHAGHLNWIFIGYRCANDFNAVWNNWHRKGVVLLIVIDSNLVTSVLALFHSDSGDRGDGYVELLALLLLHIVAVVVIDTETNEPVDTPRPRHKNIQLRPPSEKLPFSKILDLQRSLEKWPKTFIRSFFLMFNDWYLFFRNVLEHYRLRRHGLAPN